MTSIQITVEQVHVTKQSHRNVQVDPRNQKQSKAKDQKGERQRRLLHLLLRSTCS